MSCDEIRITCIIPSYNRALLTARAVRSVLDQSEPVDEIIVVDDGSTDDTHERLADLPVRYVHQENAGGAAARNVGIEIASSEWIAFLDSDDVWHGDHIRRMREAIQVTRGSAELYFADVVVNRSGASGRLWEQSGFVPMTSAESASDGTAWSFLPCQPMMLQVSVFRRSTALAKGGLDVRLRRRHDTHFFFKMSIGQPVCAVNGVGAIMTDDDVDGRLTAIWQSTSEVYLLSTVVLYRDVLNWLPAGSEFANDARVRLASAHRQLARLQLKNGNPVKATGHVVSALARSPGETFRRMIGLKDTLRVGKTAQ